MEPQLNNPNQSPKPEPLPTSTFSEPRSTNPPKLLLIILGILTLIFGASSIYFFTKLKNVSPSVPNVSVNLPSPSPVTSPDPTEDWQSYSGSTYTLKYPNDKVQTFDNLNDTTALKSNDAIMIGVPNSDVLALRLFIYNSDLDSLTWWKNIGIKKYEKLVADFVQVSNPPPSTKPFSFSQKEIEINNLIALRITGYIDSPQRGDSQITLLHNRDKIYMFEQSMINSQEDMKIIGDQILSTFKFTNDLANTNNWKEVILKDGKSSVLLPDNWKLTDKTKQVDLYNDGKLEWQQDIVIEKNGYKLISTNPLAWGPNICIFPDSPDYNSDQYFGEKYSTYTSFTKNGTELRRTKLTLNNTPNIQNWTICTQSPTDKTSFSGVSGFGGSRYETPTKYDEEILKTMDAILTKLSLSK